MEAAEPQGQEKGRSPNPRLIGAGMMGLGAVLMVAFGGWPAYQILHGAPSVTYHMKPVGMGLFVFIWGLNAILFGKKAVEWFKMFDGKTKLSEMSVVQWGLILGWLALGVFMLFKFDAWLEGLGYQKT